MIDTDEGTWTVGDTAKPLRGRILLSDLPVSLLTSTGAVANVKRPDKTVFSNPVDFDEVHDPELVGEWTMQFKVGDLTIPGPHLVEVRVTWGDDTIQTFAVDDFMVRNKFA